MLALMGIRKGVDVGIRERLVLSAKNQALVSNSLKDICEEFVILSTCNRTEIYINAEEISKEKLFELLNWDKSLMEYVFLVEGKAAIKHLFELSCGFHSKIKGEDQILGQIRDAYERSLENKYVKSKLMRLFEEAISCGKKFRNDTKLYEIPVSSSSIAVNKIVELGAEKLMVMGYGDIGSLVVKYALGTRIKEINIVVRNKDKVGLIDDERVNVLNYAEAREVINNMDGIISCTAASHLIIEKEQINKNGKKLSMIDLAVPRDIDPELENYERVTLYDIDKISKMDDKNKNLRVKRMQENKYTIEEYIKNYIEWLNVRNVSNYIRDFQHTGTFVVDDRLKSFKHKCKNNEDVQLAHKLLKSTSDYYINRAIKVLKKETLKGREEECLKILMEIFTKD